MTLEFERRHLFDNKGAFAKRRVCALCGIVELAQSILCANCRDILVIQTAAKLKIVSLKKRKMQLVQYDVELS